MTEGFSNSDLDPVPQDKRTWGITHFLSLWVGMSVCIPTYMIAASLVSGGMDWKQAVFTVFLGNTIVLIPMILVGQVGAKYGIPFPVFARASFGLKGSNLPALLRAIVACGWFGIQTWIGGAAIYSMLLVIWPEAANFPTILPAFIGVGLIPFLCFLTFWFVNLFFIFKGVESIKFLETASAPFLIACGLALLYWAYTKADGFGPIFASPSKFSNFSEFWTFFVPALTGMVGYWATLSLNIPDFTRYAKSQRSQIWGQALGLPTTMTLFAFIGVAVTSATVVVYGEAIWDPVVLVRKFDSPFIVMLSMFAVLIATLTTNVAANVVSPANDLANLAPSKINFKRGGLITGVVGILMMPWKLMEDPSGYIFTWLIGYSALLGPIVGILLVDYFLIRRCKLDVAGLYNWKGPYTYRNGWNIWAVIAFFAGVLPNLPGFLIQVKLLNTESFPSLGSLYHYAWFSGLFIAGIFYYFLMSSRALRRIGLFGC